MTAKQIKELQKRNAILEEENLILKKAIAIFTPHSNNDWMLFIPCGFSITSISPAVSFASTAAPITSIFTTLRLHAHWKTRKFVPQFWNYMRNLKNGSARIKSGSGFRLNMAYPSAPAECTVWWNPCSSPKCHPSSQKRFFLQIPLILTAPIT